MNVTEENETTATRFEGLPAVGSCGSTPSHPIIQRLDDLRAARSGEPVTVAEIYATLGTLGAPAFMLLLALPFCLPVTLPGVSVPFGLAIAYLATRVFRGLPPRLPQKIQSISIKHSIFANVVTFAERWWRRLEKAIRPRLPQVAEASWFPRVAAICIIVNGLLLCLPVPLPFTNTVPAVAIVLICLALIERDGVVAILGKFFTLLATVYVLGVLIVGKVALLRFLGWI